MKNLDLGKESINKLLLAFTIPCVISMLINSIYNIVDQIFIGQGVGTLGNAATNVIFPLVILCNAIAGLIGNGAAAMMSLRLGEGKTDDAKKSIGEAILLISSVSIIVGITSFILLPKMIYWFGCTGDVAPFALSYGRVIVLGIPFVMFYSLMSNVIRADGNPSYSMKLLIVGAIINLILDPIFIFLFKWGVAGGAWATIIGQVISAIIAAIYITKFKSFKLSKKDFLLTKQIFKVLALGLSSFITQLTILVLFVYMNNMMTKFGALTKYGENIPLSVYGVLSKINSIYISIVLGISIGAQPIIGFNYGAGNGLRVKEIIRKLLIINITFGLIFNTIYLIFPRTLAGIFISTSDPTYDLFMEFAEKLCRVFFMVCGINALEMTSSISIQSLGNVKKATSLSFARQIILFLPISFILARILGLGLNGILMAGPIADVICAIYCIIILIPEFKKLSIVKEDVNTEDIKVKPNYKGKKFIVTISREYGSGGHYVGEILARNLGVKFFDKSLIKLIADASGLSKAYVSSSDESLKSAKYMYNNDDRIFIAEERVIKNIAKNESAVIVGRCADYILKDNKNVIKVFLYSDMESKIKRVVKYYNIEESEAKSVIKRINKERKKHYKFYTNRNWSDFNNYDLAINVDKQGVEETAKMIENYINKINK